MVLSASSRILRLYAVSINGGSAIGESSNGYRSDQGAVIYCARSVVREARRVGIELPTLDVGRRKFVRGSDAIWYIEQLAAIESTLSGAAT
jgi:hypothetical protein